MKIQKLFALLLLVAPMIVSCGNDNEPIVPITGDNPHSVIGANALPYSQRMEVPAIKDPTMFIVHIAGIHGVTYSVEWDKAQKTQRWSAYSMNKSNNTKGWVRSSWNGATWKGRVWSGDPFQEDSIIPAAYRTKLADYQGSGYDRGHIVNSNDRLVSQSANGQTYYLSNIQPQLKGFNGSNPNKSCLWLKFENAVHGIGTSLRADETLYVTKGGTTQPTAKYPNPFLEDSRISIKVPRYFFMALLKYNSTKKTYQSIALWAEHKEDFGRTDVAYYAISVNELEERTGINFFHNLDDKIEEQIEDGCDKGLWF